MDDCKEVQLQEIEALESIYVSEFSLICRDYPNIAVEVIISSESFPELSSDESIGNVTLCANLPAEYPNVCPKIECIIKTKTNDQFWTELLESTVEELNKVANENLGMPMIFTLVASLQEIISREIEDCSAKTQEMEEKKKAIADQLERVHFEGSRVTVEQFNEWNEKFMKEIWAKREAEMKEKELLSGRLTGKQLFLRDDSLNVSDLQIMNSSGNVEIDASLFEDDIVDEESDEDS